MKVVDAARIPDKALFIWQRPSLCQKKIVSVEIRPEGTLEVSWKNREEITFHNCSFKGLPRAFSGDQLSKLPQFFDNVLAEVRGGGVIFSGRIRGGMFPAALSAVSSGFGFLSSGNYLKMVGRAGAEARATIQVGGEEMRATLQKAEQFADATLRRAGAEVRQSVRLVGNEARQTVRDASSEACLVLQEAGIQSRQTAKVMEIQVEHVLDRTARHLDYLLQEASLQSQRTIRLGGEELKQTCFVLDQMIQANINAAGERSCQVLTHGGEQIRAILNQAQIEATTLIRAAGSEYAEKSTQIIRQALMQVDDVISKILGTFDESVENWITTASSQARGLIIDLGKQGQLWIEQAGQEVRMSANAILTQAFHGQTMVIKEAGEEMRLTIGQATFQLRSVLHEIPYITAQMAEALGENFAYGLVSGFWGKSEAQAIVQHMKNAMRRPGVTIEGLIEFVSEQNQLRSKDKFELYKTLVASFNIESVGQEGRQYFFLKIGVAAFEDPDLKDQLSGGFFGTAREIDYAEELIKNMPGKAQSILQEKREKALEIYLPRVTEFVLPLIESSNPLTEVVEGLKLKQLAGENALALEQKKVLLEKARVEQEVSEKERLSSSLAEFCKQNDVLKQNNENLKSELDKQKEIAEKNIQYLKMQLSEVQKNYQTLDAAYKSRVFS